MDRWGNDIWVLFHVGDVLLGWLLGWLWGGNGVWLLRGIEIWILLLGWLLGGGIEIWILLQNELINKRLHGNNLCRFDRILIVNLTRLENLMMGGGMEEIGGGWEG